MPDGATPRLSYGWLLGNHRAVKLVVLLLLAVDVLIFGVHWYAVARGSSTRVFYLDTELSYGEVVQYFEFAWLVILVGIYALEHRSWQVAMWLPAFAYFLADDALMIHERLGRRLADAYGLQETLGPQGLELGQHLVSGLAGILLLIPLVAGYVRGRPSSRWIYRGFLVLVGVLLFFGIVVDGLHVLLIENPRRGDWLGFIEDGGEMLAASAMVAFALRLNLSGGAPGLPISEGRGGRRLTGVA